MQKWEYTYLDLDTANTFSKEGVEGIVDKLNELGSQGWELVNFVDQGGKFKFIFKRRKKKS